MFTKIFISSLCSENAEHVIAADEATAEVTEPHEVRGHAKNSAHVTRAGHVERRQQQEQSQSEASGERHVVYSRHCTQRRENGVRDQRAEQTRLWGGETQDGEESQLTGGAFFLWSESVFNEKVFAY